MIKKGPFPGKVFIFTFSSEMELVPQWLPSTLPWFTLCLRHKKTTESERLFFLEKFAKILYRTKFKNKGFFLWGSILNAKSVKKNVSNWGSGCRQSLVKLLQF